MLPGRALSGQDVCALQGHYSGGNLVG